MVSKYKALEYLVDQHKQELISDEELLSQIERELDVGLLHQTEED